MPLGPRRLSNRTAGAFGLTPEEHAKCSERSEPRLFDALHIQRELFPRSCRGTLMMWAFFTGSSLPCPSRCWSKGAGAFRTAQTSVPPSATGRTVADECLLALMSLSRLARGRSRSDPLTRCRVDASQPPAGQARSYGRLHVRFRSPRHLR